MKRPEVLVDGVPVELNGVEADVRQVEPGVFSIVLTSGRSFEARVADGMVHIDGRWMRVEVRDPRELGDSASSRGLAGRAEITAPMPGKVVRYLVAEGDTVEAGQGIVVVEAMKMQNEMPSPKAGRVSAVKAKTGDAVSAGQVLAVIE